jgi:hypothetical protein
VRAGGAWQAGVMAFKLFTDKQGTSTDYGDEASYTFNNAGLLVVDDGQGLRLTFSPNVWHHIEDDMPQGGMNVFR